MSDSRYLEPTIPSLGFAQGFEDLLKTSRTAAVPGVLSGASLMDLLSFIIADMGRQFAGRRIPEGLSGARGYVAYLNARAALQRVDIVFTDEVGTPGCPPGFVVGNRYRLGRDAVFAVEPVGRNLSLGIELAR